MVHLAQFTSPGPMIGPLPIRWYGFLIASAVLIGTTLAAYLAKRRGVNPDLLSDLTIWLVIAAIPCARLYYVAFEWENYAQRPAEIFAIWHGGIAIHGAILGGIVATLIFARLRKTSFWLLADLVAAPLILGQAIGRWGNFFNSEAFGAPTDLPWKLYIAPQFRPSGYEQFSYFHPTFLYESLWNLGVFGLLLTLFFRSPKAARHPGTLFLVYLVAYSLGRFWIEGLRTDSLMLGPIRMAQVISLVGIGIGSLGLVWLYGMRRSLPDVVSPAQLQPQTSPAADPQSGSQPGSRSDRS
ncbi:MAG: prolipoprotein diacylglyceryl transferase [Oculatellaceae cyanobacterium Prado106]|jgi:phosphatidylglycerol:prolipoprotein diacylglycerol transferase|nr:prolipoprotein diacylglyceryl transferase [Oculatellaceae cyanobacterium Prado106]